MGLKEFVSQFQSMTVWASIQNTTSKKQIKKQAELQIVEFLDTGMIVELPSVSCEPGDYLSLAIEVDRPNAERFKFFTGSKVEERKLITSTVAQVTLHFIQYDEKGWEDFRQLFTGRQKEIEEFFRSVKGY